MYSVHAESDIVDSETDSVICATSARIYFTNTADEVVAVSAALSLNRSDRTIHNWNFFLRP